jgi:tRNA(Ile)-lysidine synthase
MRLFAGTSLQGAGGIRQMRRFAIEGTEIHLWRPLLKIRRFELENFLHENGQSWLTDQTNFSDEFLRNAVRQNIVPEIEKLFPRAGLKIQSLIYDIQEVQTLIEEQARGFLCKNVTDDKKTLKLKELAPVIKREVLRLWLLDLGFKREITRNLIERLVDLWETKSKGRRLDHRKFKFERTVENIIFID